MDITKPVFCRHCGKSVTHSDVYCSNCGYQLRRLRASNPATAQAARDPQLRPASKNPQIELVGVRGWLAWFSAGVALTPIVAGYSLFIDIVSFQIVAGQGYMGIAIVECLANISLIALSIWGLVLLKQHRRLAVNIFISLMLVSVVISLIDLIFVLYLQAKFGLHADSSQTAATARSLIIALIWIPYFLRSRRVQTTLVA